MAFAWKFGTTDARRVIDAATSAIAEKEGYCLPVSLVVTGTDGTVLAAQSMPGAADGFIATVDRAKRAADPNVISSEAYVYPLSIACDTFREERRKPLSEYARGGHPADFKRPVGWWLGGVAVTHNDRVVAGLAAVARRSLELPCASTTTPYKSIEDYGPSELIYSLELGSRWRNTIWEQLGTLVWLENSFFTHLPPEAQPVVEEESPRIAPRQRRRGSRGGGRRSRSHMGFDPGQLITDEFRLFMQGRESLRDDDGREPW